MGRGRQKAKQTKVARELKYFSPHTDYRALERELTSRSKDVDPYAPVSDEDEYEDQFEDAEDEDELGDTGESGWPVRATR